MPGVVLTTLTHYIDLEFLGEAYQRTRKDGATGVDDVTAKEYASKLDENLALLLERFKSGTYWGATGATRSHSERRWDEDPAHRHPHVRRQGASACGDDGDGSGL